jgi:hypothetical protein
MQIPTDRAQMKEEGGGTKFLFEQDNGNWKIVGKFKL